MKTIRVLIVVMLALFAAQSVQAFEPNWGEKVPVFIGGEEFKDFANSSFSPDGSTLVFSAPQIGIFTIGVTGGNASCILAQPTKTTGISHRELSYSPDGTQIAFCATGPSSAGFRIWIYNVTTGESHPIGLGYTPAWSHDSRYISYVREIIEDGLHYEWLLVYDTVTGEERTIRENPKDIGHYNYPSFFPDDSALIYSFVVIDEKHADLYTVSLNGGQPRMISIIDDTGNKYWYTPRMHPDGIHAIVTKGDNSMAWVNLQTGRVQQLTPPPAKNGEGVLNPEFSKDGTKISFTHYVPNPDPHYIGASCEIWILDVDEPILKDVYPSQVTSAPSPLDLLQNYPNPFNPSTTISFILPEPGQAILTIHDMLGRQIRTLVDGIVPAGRHEAVWNGRDEAGKIVANGIYFSRLEAGNAVKTNKMLLMK